MSESALGAMKRRIANDSGVKSPDEIVAQLSDQKMSHAVPEKPMAPKMPAKMPMKKGK